MDLRFPVFRFGVALTAAVMLCAAPQAAPAQDAQGPQVQPTPPAEPPAKLPRPQRGDRKQNLDFLFGALQAAPDSESSKAIEERIWALWFASGSDTADLLMSRVKTATDEKDTKLALQLLESTPVR